MKFFMYILIFSISMFANNFDKYLSTFDYKERSNMKIKMVEMLNLVEENKAQVIDIRFKEEYEVWHLNFTKNIPLNELPKRLDELDKNKLIITVCPHNDRANIARMYLRLKGYNVRYLSDGLLKAVDYLRGDNAKEFLFELENKKEKL